jgi:uncharacterized membrane protein YeaQ/YmgE (transglycosylase-associated protein family)
MGIIAWIVLGLIAGFIASLLVNKRGEGWFMDIILGIVGAVVGGFIAHLAGWQGISGFNMRSMLVAVAGAVLVLIIYHAATGTRGRTTNPPNSPVV